MHACDMTREPNSTISYTNQLSWGSLGDLVLVIKAYVMYIHINFNSIEILRLVASLFMVHKWIENIELAMYTAYRSRNEDTYCYTGSDSGAIGASLPS